MVSYTYINEKQTFRAKTSGALDDCHLSCYTENGIHSFASISCFGVNLYVKQDSF